MNECRSCGANAEYYLGEIKYNKPVGWYCEKCIENMPKDSLKEGTKLMAVAKNSEEKLKDKKLLTPGIISWKS